VKIFSICQKKNIKVQRNKLILNQTFSENIKKKYIFKPRIDYQYYFLAILHISKAFIKQLSFINMYFYEYFDFVDQTSNVKLRTI